MSTSTLVSNATKLVGIFPAMGIADRLKGHREAQSLSQNALAKKAGVSQQLISQLERGENLTTKKLPQILKALNLPLSELDAELARELGATTHLIQVKGGEYNGRELNGRTLTFAGVVEAGAFRAVDEYFTQGEVEVPEFVQAHPGYPRARQFTWRVSGSSMNKAGIEDGMWVVGADYGDYLDQYGQIESGAFVVVERSRAGDSERELTVKEVRFYRDRYELLPRSTEDGHAPIIVRHDHQADPDTETVRLLAIVLAAYRDLSPRP